MALRFFLAVKAHRNLRLPEGIWQCWPTPFDPRGRWAESDANFSRSISHLGGLLTASLQAATWPWKDAPCLAPAVAGAQHPKQGARNKNQRSTSSFTSRARPCPASATGMPGRATMALSTRGRGAHAAPSGVTTSFRPPRFLNVRGMWTVIVSPSAETVARVMPLPSCRPPLPGPTRRARRPQPDLDACIRTSTRSTSSCTIRACSAGNSSWRVEPQLCRPRCDLPSPVSQSARAYVVPFRRYVNCSLCLAADAIEALTARRRDSLSGDRSPRNP